MELTFKLKGLDCPNCAAKIENEVRALDVVSDAAVNLMQQSLKISTASAQHDLNTQITEIVHKFEPDVAVIPQNGKPRVYTLKGLDCPNCAAKIENEVRALDAVSDASVNLMQQSLTVTAPAAQNLDTQITEIVHKFEPDVAVIPQDSKAEPQEEPDEIRSAVLRIVIGAVLYVIGIVLTKLGLGAAIVLPCMLIAYAILGWDVFAAVLQSFRRFSIGTFFDEHLLMTVSTVGAFALGEYPEAVAVMLFYQIGEMFQSLAVRNSRRSISALLDIRPDSANVCRNGTVLAVPSAEVAVGEQIVVRAGERVPLDGIVIDGESMLDTAALTGESVPRRVKAGDDALSGCINQNGTLTIEVTKPFGESTATKIIDMVENASARKAPAENFITKFAHYYTPAVVLTAALLAVIPPLCFGGMWAEWIRRAFVFLIVSCPCALVISVPLTFFGGIGAASRCGVLVKGSNYLEALSQVKQIVFDKTGTLTQGVFRVTEIIPADGYTEAQVLRLAAGCELNSNHPIAASVLNAYAEEIGQQNVSDIEEIPGFGMRACVDGKAVLAGSGKLMAQNKIAYRACEKAGTKVYVAADGQFAGCILIADELKSDSKAAVSALRDAGMEKLIMLTGDDKAIAAAVAGELGLDAYEAELLPSQKVEHLEKLVQNGTTAFVGDGINDAPVLARADVGIAMGAIGSDAAIEAADVVLMTDAPARLADAVRIARRTKRIVMQNIVFALGIKLVILVLGAIGIAGMWEAVFGDVGVTVLAVLNAMRIMRKNG